jgi:hypothetical protein
VFVIASIDETMLSGWNRARQSPVEINIRYLRRRLLRRPPLADSQWQTFLFFDVSLMGLLHKMERTDTRTSLMQSLI